mgnify:CR=1 FL=1
MTAALVDKVVDHHELEQKVVARGAARGSDVDVIRMRRLVRLLAQVAQKSVGRLGLVGHWHG